MVSRSPILTIYLLIFIFAAASVNALDGNEKLSRTAKIKSAVIFQLTRFIRPSEKSLKSGKLQICAIDNSDLVKELGPLLYKQSAQHVRLLLKDGFGLAQLNTPSVDACDWMVVDRAVVSDTMFSKIKATVRVPLICATKTLQWDGCMIEIFEESNKAKIAIDLDVVTKTQTNVSSELLDLAILRGTQK